MDRKLYDAAMSGNVTSLLDSLQQDPAILDRVVASSVTETPMHIAALCGHLHFARVLLDQKPELAHQRNSQGLSPLHLASAKGDVEMVKGILDFVPDISLDRDREGRTPLHTAAMKGRIDVLNEFIRINRDWVRDRNGRGETLLHMCVKHDQLETLKMLIREVGDEDFVNQKEENGNTILHLATSKKHIDIVRYLLSETEVKVNEINGRGLTALDLLDIDTDEDLLRQKGAKRSWEISPGHVIPKRLLAVDGNVTTNELRPAIMVAATLIALVSFQAGLNPPGGVWQDDFIAPSNSTITSSNMKNHRAGTSILSDKDPIAYTIYSIFNRMAFVSSLVVLFDGIGGVPLPWAKQLKTIKEMKTTFLVSLISMSFTFVYSSIRLSQQPILALIVGIFADFFLPSAIKLASQLF